MKTFTASAALMLALAGLIAATDTSARPHGHVHRGGFHGHAHCRVFYDHGRRERVCQ